MAVIITDDEQNRGRTTTSLVLGMNDIEDERTDSIEQCNNIIVNHKYSNCTLVMSEFYINVSPTATDISFIVNLKEKDFILFIDGVLDIKQNIFMDIEKLKQYYITS